MDDTPLGRTEKKSSKSNRDFVVSCCAAVVALCALCSSLYDGFQNRRYQRLSQKPEYKLDWGISAEDNFFYISALNRGNGPAIVKWFSLFIDNKEVESWDDLNALVTGAGRYTFSVPWYNTFFRPSDKPAIYYRQIDSEKSRELVRMVRQSRIDAAVCYCSIFEECQISSMYNLPATLNLTCERHSKFRMPPSFK